MPRQAGVHQCGQRCQDCHADIHKRQLGANCEQCHTVRGWQVSIQQIQQHNNRFPLTGAHAAVDCDSCHKGAANSKFQTMSTDVLFLPRSGISRRPTIPNHVAGKFSTTCDGCHGTDNWLNAKFDHNSVGFPLTGGHAVPPRQCTDCHVNNNYNLTSTACFSCHQKDFAGATTPVRARGLPHDLRAVPRHGAVERWQVRPLDHRLYPDGLPHGAAAPVRGLPRQQQLQAHQYNLRFVPPEGFQNSTNPSHVTRELLADLPTCHTPPPGAGQLRSLRR